MSKIIDYNELNAELNAVHAGIRASESHGFLCGHFCSSNSADIGSWQDHLLAGIDAAEDMEDCLDILSQLAAQVAEEIVDENISLRLLLPGDDSAISERSGAVAEWCAGFVSGLGIGGIGDQTIINDECDEFIKDIIAISRMETSVEESEDAENDLFEIVEYIRVGVIMLHHACYQLSTNSGQPEVLH